jgi:DNA repair exonuclease SbcCD ATPase subunit
MQGALASSIFTRFCLWKFLPDLRMMPNMIEMAQRVSEIEENMAELSKIQVEIGHSMATLLQNLDHRFETWTSRVELDRARDREQRVREREQDRQERKQQGEALKKELEERRREFEEAARRREEVRKKEGEERRREFEAASLQRAEENRKRSAEFDRRWEVQRKENHKILKDMKKQWGDLANKMGTVAEDVVAPNIPRLALEEFGFSKVNDLMVRASRASRRGTSRTAEFDIVCAGPEKVIVAEVKSTPTVEKIREVPERIKEFYDFYPEYEGLELIPVVASWSFPKRLLVEVSACGLYGLAMGEETMDIVARPKSAPGSAAISGAKQ